MAASLALAFTRLRAHARDAHVARAGKGKRKSQRLDTGGLLDAATTTPQTKNIAGALGPVSCDPDALGDTVEFFLFARRKASAGGDDERWLPLGDVVLERSTNVDDVARERYHILRDYAKKRHLRLNVGNGGLEIGARVQKGVAKHPNARDATEIVYVACEETAFTWDATASADATKRFGSFPATLRLLNNAEPLTAAVKNRMLKASAQFAAE
jgi:hypothetical protein